MIFLQKKSVICYQADSPTYVDENKQPLICLFQESHGLPQCKPGSQEEERGGKVKSL